ncbi:MAG: hypothetical protein HYX83_01745, partial [Chloroflexi bacterium]|nr:hypothetical protein [Chloroflexota bacterium]
MSWRMLKKVWGWRGLAITFLPLSVFIVGCQSYSPVIPQGTGSPEAPVPFGESVSINITPENTELRVRLLDIESYKTGGVKPTPFYSDSRGDYYIRSANPSPENIYLEVKVEATFMGERPPPNSLRFKVSSDGKHRNLRVLSEREETGWGQVTQ